MEVYDLQTELLYRESNDMEQEETRMSWTVDKRKLISMARTDHDPFRVVAWSFSVPYFLVACPEIAFHLLPLLLDVDLPPLAFATP